MFIDNKGRLFGKVNLLDIFFTFIILAIFAVLVFFFFSPKSAEESIAVTYTMEIQNQESEFADQIAVNGKVLDFNTRKEMGTVKKVEKKPAKITAQADDKLVIATPENRYDVYIEIEAEAKLDYPDMKMGDHSLKIGNHLSLLTANVSANGYVVALDYEEEKLEAAKVAFRTAKEGQ